MIELRRHEEPWQDRVHYTYECDACRKAVTIATTYRLVMLPKRVESAPRSGEHPASFMLDILDGGPEKRARVAEVRRHEERFEEYARHELARGGCPHAKAAVLEERGREGR